MAEGPSLPSPITVTDDYLQAIHGLLGEIRDRLPAAEDSEPKPGPTKVSEPGAPPAKAAPAKRATRKN